MNELDFHHLRCVLALAEELNFGRAAERLHMSQPPLSRLIAEVEQEVGARLFERTTRRVLLTPVGEVFVAEARAVLARAEQAFESVRAAVRRQSGKLRIAYTWLALNTVLPQVIAQLRECDHDLTVDLVDLPGDAQREALASGHVEMGFTDEPFAADRFESVLLHTAPLNVVVPTGHRLAGAGAVTLLDLAGETLLLHPRHEYPRFYDRLLQACEEAGFRPKLHHREARENCAALVTAGRGVILAPSLGHQTLAAGFHRLPLTGAPLYLRAEVWAVLPTHSASERLNLLREVVHAHASTTGPLNDTRFPP